MINDEEITVIDCGSEDTGKVTQLMTLKNGEQLAIGTSKGVISIYDHA